MKQGTFNMLHEILCDDNKIIIPDLQRDYCWGTTYPKDKKESLAMNFASELIFDAQKDINYHEFSYGIIYTYTYPETFLYLCDGQQRLTTLYLIIGLLNCYHKDERFVQLLQTQNKLPRLKYEVRNSTDYFIKNLVSEVFIKGNSTHVEKLTTANWFRKEYDHDPSVKSMIEAIKSINACMVGQDYTKIANFILNKIGFIYIDLEADDKKEEKSYSKIREYGEKMYEIVNTTGDPMEYNEHLKSVLLAKLDEKDRPNWTVKWEIWQDFFWVNKRSEIESADDGFNEFLKWIEAVSSDELTIEIVEKYFKAFFLIVSLQDKITMFRKFNTSNIRGDFRKNQQPNKVVLFPLLNYLFNADLVDFTNDQYVVKEVNVKYDVLFRFIRFFSNLALNSDAGIESLSLSKELVYPQDISTLDFSTIVDDSKLFSSTEESYKLNLYRNLGDETERQTVENALWLAEDHKYLNGKIKPLLDLMGLDLNNMNTDDFEISTFNAIYQQFVSVMDDEINLEKVRIALLAMSPNFNFFREGDSDGTDRYYLLTANDLRWWRVWVSNSTFLNMMKAVVSEAQLDEIISSAVEKNEDPIKKEALVFLKNKANDYWQWRNNKRFYILQNLIYFPNGSKKGSNTSPGINFIESNNAQIAVLSSIDATG